MTTFKELGLSQETLQVLDKKGFETPTPIQALSIPHMLKSKQDVVAQAQTGTGKTAAFGLPILEQLKSNSEHVQVIVLTPTRELCIQVAEELNSLKGNKGLRVIPIYGGQSIDQQLRALKKGVDVVVGTPGRIMDHLKRKKLDLKKISYLVLDEADEMLDMGFQEDLETILSHTNESKQVMMFSATMPPAILTIAKKYLGDYETLKASQDQVITTQAVQLYFEVKRGNKFEALCRIIDIEVEFYGIVFCRTKVEVDDVVTHLLERGYDADALHGDIPQAQRTKVLAKFKKKTITILVATDVAARGIDVQDLTHVINYTLPHDPEAYIHRVGRTGRAGKEGTAITFISPSEYRKLNHIQRTAKTSIQKGELPGAKEIIQMKRDQIKEQLAQVAGDEIKREYRRMAGQLLEDYEPEVLVAALLKTAFQGELDKSKYPELDTKGGRDNVDVEGKTRLFVSRGKKDGLTVQDLIQVIQDKCSIPSNKIRNIEILDNFSFVSLPFKDAEEVLKFFKKNQSDFVFTKANRDKKGSGGGRRSGSSSRGGRERSSGRDRDEKGTKRSKHRGGASKAKKKSGTDKRNKSLERSIKKKIAKKMRQRNTRG